jgi:transcriptional regulator with XRE-family HTH domain
MDKLIAEKIVSIGQKTRARRKELGLTLFELAVDSEVSLSVISDLERCLASGLTICTLIKIATALNITPEELFAE